MIKAEIIHSASINDHIIIGQVQLEAKGKHHELVAELGSIISTFYEKKEYQTDVLMIFEKLIKEDLDKKKEKYDQSTSRN